MDFEAELSKISENLVSNYERILTEEATKNASVLPFIRMLGFDVFDPSIVVPEFTADVGTKKGEKVDYALKLTDGSLILMECKALNVELEAKHHSQLHRYFGVTDAKFSILTNGQNYWFYTDLDKPNVMDATPFLKFDLLEYRPREVRELKKFHRSEFDTSAILSSAERLKYVSQIKTALKTELEENPSDEFVKLIASYFYDGRITSSIKEMLAPLIVQSHKEMVNERLKRQFASALSIDEPVNDVEEEIETTPDEIEAYLIVKSIVRPTISVDRVFMRDAKSYCAILLDDNNRKPILRLHFNSKNYAISILDKDRNETRHSISNLDEIYNFSDEITAAVVSYGV